eukprot:gene51361-62805_t
MPSAAAGALVPGLGQFADFFLHLQDKPVGIPLDAVVLGVAGRRCFKLTFKTAQHGDSFMFVSVLFYCFVRVGTSRRGVRPLLSMRAFLPSPGSFLAAYALRAS